MLYESAVDTCGNSSLKQTLSELPCPGIVLQLGRVRQKGVGLRAVVRNVLDSSSHFMSWKILNATCLRYVDVWIKFEAWHVWGAQVPQKNVSNWKHGWTCSQPTNGLFSWGIYKSANLWCHWCHLMSALHSLNQQGFQTYWIYCLIWVVFRNNELWQWVFLFLSLVFLLQFHVVVRCILTDREGANCIIYFPGPAWRKILNIQPEIDSRELLSASCKVDLEQATVGSLAWGHTTDDDIKYHDGWLVVWWELWWRGFGDAERSIHGVNLMSNLFFPVSLYYFKLFTFKATKGRNKKDTGSGDFLQGL